MGVGSKKTELWERWLANGRTGFGNRIRGGAMKIFVIVGGTQYLLRSIPLCLLLTTLDDILGFHLKNVGEIRAYRQFQHEDNLLPAIVDDFKLLVDALANGTIECQSQ